MKYQFNLEPIIIEAETPEEAWKEFEEYEGLFECNDMWRLGNENLKVSLL